MVRSVHVTHPNIANKGPPIKLLRKSETNQQRWTVLEREEPLRVATRLSGCGPRRQKEATCSAIIDL